jgi:hypothetical protein
MFSTDLADAVAAFAQSAVGIPEARMTVELAPSELADDAPWQGYLSVREVYYRVYQDLRDLAARRGAARRATRAQRILAQHQFAWRDLCGALVGVRDDELDSAPAAGEWPLREVLDHLLGAERGFTGLTMFALEHARQPRAEPIAMPTEHPLGETYPADVSGSLADILVRFDALHRLALSTFEQVTDAELAAPSRFWEENEQVVAFRLHRFDAHLREHTIQVDKTLAGIGHAPGEAERLTRLIYNALGEAEGAALGTAPNGDDAALCATLRRLAELVAEN